MKIFAVATVLALLPSMVQASDLPSKSTAPSAPSARAFSWQGLYVGANAGFVSNSSSGTFLDGYEYCWNSCGSEYSGTHQGAIGGGQVGFNYQTGNIVIGVEADISASSGDITNHPDSDETYNNSLDTFGTVRARVGVAMDRALVYVTGGLAYGDVTQSYFNYDGDYDDVDPGVDVAFTNSGWKNGWTVGAGLEYAIDNNWSVKAEGLYYDLGSDIIESDDTEGDLNAMEFVNNGYIGRIGVNYKF